MPESRQTADVLIYWSVLPGKATVRANEIPVSDDQATQTEMFLA
jgi:hypothetical protein